MKEIKKMRDENPKLTDEEIRKIAKEKGIHLTEDDIRKLKPDYSEAYVNRALIYKTKGDKENAIADFRKVLQLSNVAEAIKIAQDELKAMGIEVEQPEEDPTEEK